MDSCDGFFLLVSGRDRQSEREIAFYEELKRQGKADLVEQMTCIEVPYWIEKNDSWKKTIQQWRWGEIGDQVRRYIQAEC